VTALADLERIRQLFEILETLRPWSSCSTPRRRRRRAIFIGAETALFGLSGCSVVISPFTRRRSHRQIVGAIGVIGPTRISMRGSSRWSTTPRAWSAACWVDPICSQSRFELNPAPVCPDKTA
jgi:hypothetical protein